MKLNIKSILSGISKKRVLVVGDAMIDHYIWGEVRRISPEAPVPVLHVDRESNTLGGAGNVVLNLAVLGVKTELLSCWGNDHSGVRLRDLLKKEGIKTPRCMVADKVPTIIKTRVVARNQQICRIDYEAAQREYDLERDRGFAKNLEKAISLADAVIVSDYAKGVVTQSTLNWILKLGGKYKKLVAIDPKPSRQLDLKGVGLMTPNRSEALELAGIADPAHNDEYPLEEVCKRIHKKYAPGLLIVTLGADGMAVCRNGKIVKTMPTEAREVFDVSGAGDTVIATLTAALAAGLNPVEAASFANCAAGIVVSKMGTATASIEELLAIDKCDG